MGITAIPREIENNASATFWGADKVHYGRCASGVLRINIANQIHVLRAYNVTAFSVESPFRAAPVITESVFWVCAYDIIFKFAFYVPLGGRKAVIYIEERIFSIHP